MAGKAGSSMQETFAVQIFARGCNKISKIFENASRTVLGNPGGNSFARLVPNGKLNEMLYLCIMACKLNACETVMLKLEGGITMYPNKDVYLESYHSGTL